MIEHDRPGRPGWMADATLFGEQPAKIFSVAFRYKHGYSSRIMVVHVEALNPEEARIRVEGQCGPPGTPFFATMIQVFAVREVHLYDLLHNGGFD